MEEGAGDNGRGNHFFVRVEPHAVQRFYFNKRALRMIIEEDKAKRRERGLLCISGNREKGRKGKKEREGEQKGKHKPRRTYNQVSVVVTPITV